MFDNIAYMRNIAIKLKDIAYNSADAKNRKFARISTIGSIEEVLQGITYTDGFILVAQDDFYSRFEDNGSENIQDRLSHIFYIIKHIKDSSDFNALEQNKKDCLAICNKVIAKMRKDKKWDFEPNFPKTGMRNLEVNSIYRQRVGPLANNLYGIMCGYTMLNSVNADLKYNEDDWNSDIIS